MNIICFLVAFFACVLGKLCGMGGGVIIKPVLDAMGLMEVAAINFLSGCTVIGMTCWSVGASLAKRESEIDLALSTPLAIGAAVGGLLGKQLFSVAAGCFPDRNMAGGVQAGLLLLATLATLVFMRNRRHLTMLHVRNKAVCILIGLGLGTLGTFLGIGGGPFNMAALYYFFAMSTKVAAQNSLYVILISQVVGILATICSSGVPHLSLRLLIGMAACGVIGGEVGARINRRLQEHSAARLLEAAMVLVMAVSCYNIHSFLG